MLFSGGNRLPSGEDHCKKNVNGPQNNMFGTLPGRFRTIQFIGNSSSIHRPFTVSAAPTGYADNIPSREDLRFRQDVPCRNAPPEIPLFRMEHDGT